VLEDGVYYVMRPAGSEELQLRTVRTVTDVADMPDYCCITQSDLQLRSPDGQYGVELALDHSIHVWKTAPGSPEYTASIRQQNAGNTADQKSPIPKQTGEQSALVRDRTLSTIDGTREQLVPAPQHCCVLRGHAAEVTCVSWTRTERRLLVSGSRDNTIRLWSVLGAGSQLCLFHVLGTIDNVRFDDAGRHVVVHCSYAPQRKRAIVLKIANVYDEEREPSDSCLAPPTISINRSAES